MGVVIDDLRFNEPGIERLPVLDVSPSKSVAPFVAWLRGMGRDRSEPLYVDGRTIAFVSGSQGWGLWVEQDTELAVLGVPRDTLGAVREVLASSGLGPWFEATEVDQVLGPAYHPKPPSQLLREFRRQYAAVRGG